MDRFASLASLYQCAEHASVLLQSGGELVVEGAVHDIRYTMPFTGANVPIVHLWTGTRTFHNQSHGQPAQHVARWSHPL